MKTWKPDTCKCEVEEIYSGIEIVGGGKVIFKCLAHVDIDDSDLYDILLNKENRPKNMVYRILLGYEDIKDLELDEMKDGSKTLKQGIEYKWRYKGIGADRKLLVEVKGASLSQDKKDAISALCETKFGKGKVEIG